MALMKEHMPTAKHLLELCCGAGLHADKLARLGFRVTGVEFNHVKYKQALACAEQHDDKLDGFFFPTFCQDFASLSAGLLFDVVYSLNFVSYQLETARVKTLFEKAREHLSGSGIFIFDALHAATMESKAKSVSVRRVKNADIRVVRVEEHSQVGGESGGESIVQLDSETFIGDSSSMSYHAIAESVRKRYFLPEEIETLASEVGLYIVRSEEWLTGQPVSNETRDLAFVLRKR